MKPMNDYRFVRGVNYYPFPTDEERLRRELSFGRRVNLNALRVWLDFHTWERRGADYVGRLVESVRVAYDCGYQTMPILFNGNGENSATIPRDRWPAMEAYVAEIVTALRDEPGLLAWDVMNEPLCCWWIDGCADAEEKARRKETVWEFLRHFIPCVREHDLKNAVTVGYTTAWEAEDSINALTDLITFHDYSPTRAVIEANFARAAEIGKKFGQPVLQTETGCLARCNPYDMALETCEKYGMGWMVFELMIHDRCDSEHGVFYADGTVRDPATIAAMMGCYRCRDLGTIVVPVPNREGHAARAIDGIKQALTEYTDDAFDYRPSDIVKLLDACEVAANLLECCDLVPMATPPTAKILAWRRLTDAGQKPPLGEVRAFAYGLAKELKELCQIL
ncbi:MAG: cellulase family glycosylhydrolase [Clostridia bacterium]|nr:cellulase family glycosylhydrolase [Clostridia bacterium]